MARERRCGRYAERAPIGAAQRGAPRESVGTASVHALGAGLAPALSRSYLRANRRTTSPFTMRMIDRGY